MRVMVTNAQTSRCQERIGDPDISNHYLGEPS
jgi:hypothetical protein